MQWKLVQAGTGQLVADKAYLSEDQAEQARLRLGPAIAGMVRLHVECDNKAVQRMINEGLVERDLEGILLPKISIDEYVPADPNTDNVVVAFMIKGVPEAVIPFKNFCENTSGVLSVDYGDSDTSPNTSLVYVEFDRENIDVQQIDDLMIQVGMLCGIDKDDFQITFPTSNAKYPYSTAVLSSYFMHRSREDNLLAQQQALKSRMSDIQQDAHGQVSPAAMESRERLIDELVERAFPGDMARRV